jgi:methyltransferase-like protein
MDLNAVPVIASEFNTREVDEETVILAPSGDEVISLNAVGTFIWKQIDGQHELRDIVDILCDEYEVERAQAETDVTGFVQQLLDHGLITLSETGS